MGEPRARIPRLDAIHEAYARHPHEETVTSAHLARLGHPCAAKYSEARALFDSLTWHASESSRFHSFRDEWNNVEVSPPRLSLTWHPGGFAGITEVYPLSGPAWDAYVQAAADAGFPEQTRPSAFYGCWTLRSRDAALREQIAQALAASGIRWRGFDGCMELRCHSADRWTEVRDVAAEVFAPWRLRDYTPVPVAPSGPIRSTLAESAAAARVAPAPNAKPARVQDALMLF